MRLNSQKVFSTQKSEFLRFPFIFELKDNLKANKSGWNEKPYNKIKHPLYIQFQHGIKLCHYKNFR